MDNKANSSPNTMAVRRAQGFVASVKRDGRKGLKGFLLVKRDGRKGLKGFALVAASTVNVCMQNCSSKVLF